MALKKVFDRNVVLPDYKYSDKYWPLLTDLIHNKIGEEEIKKPETVQILLKDCFIELCSILDQKISEQRKASFYIFCQNLHEDSIEIWREQVKGNELGEIKEDFAASRRILKIILEQSCKLKLVGTPIFINEIEQNLDTYTEYLEELLYIGTWCHTLSEYIARSQLFPNSIGIVVKDGTLNIYTYQPYPTLFKFLFQEMQSHNSEVVISDSIHGFKTLLKNEFNISYDVLASFVNHQLEDKKYKFGLLKMNEVIEDIIKQFDYNLDFTNTFYEGLTVNENNSLSIADCLLQNQHENRHVFRPILELDVDDEKYNIIGINKWSESLMLLTTNSFPFGLYPSEWKRYPEIKNFVNEIDNTHDKILENPIIDLLKEKNRIFDNNVDSFSKYKGDNINIKNDVGDIDILFLDTKYKIIYVCECKHNRSRHDLNNWKRDYSNFKGKYESQLLRKVNWVNANKDTVEEHLKLKFPKQTDFELNKFETIGIFIINAPTVYMLNGVYRAFTIKDIKDILDYNYVDIKFELTNEDTGEQILLEHPYFDNLEKKI